MFHNFDKNNISLKLCKKKKQEEYLIIQEENP